VTGTSEHVNVNTYSLNRLEFRGNYSATSNNMKLVYWTLMGGLLHCTKFWCREEGTRRGRSPPRPLLAVPNVTSAGNPSTASVPITVLLYNGTLLLGFNESLKVIQRPLTKCFIDFYCNKNLAHNTSRAFIGLNITLWPWNLGYGSFKRDFHKKVTQRTVPQRTAPSRNATHDQFREIRNAT